MERVDRTQAGAQKQKPFLLGAQRVEQKVSPTEEKQCSQSKKQDTLRGIRMTRTQILLRERGDLGTRPTMLMSHNPQSPGEPQSESVWYHSAGEVRANHPAPGTSWQLP